MSLLYRSAEVGPLDSDERTIAGRAVWFDRPSQVRDPGSLMYLEEIARSAVNPNELGPLPLGMLHPWQPGARTSPVPLGAVMFDMTPEALMFRARLSKTTAGDEALELVRDGALLSVSLGFQALRSARRITGAGAVVRREAIRVFELSLAPTGMGQHAGAAVLATRSTPTAPPTLEAFRRRRLRGGPL